MLREAMSTVFQKQPDFCLVDSIRYSPAAYKLVASSNCDVLLADQASAAAFPRILSVTFYPYRQVEKQSSSAWRMIRKSFSKPCEQA